MFTSFRWYTNGVICKLRNRRILVVDNNGYIDVIFKKIDHNYPGPEAYIHHYALRNKLVINGIKLNRDSADALMFALAAHLGYTPVKNIEE